MLLAAAVPLLRRWSPIEVHVGFVDFEPGSAGADGLTLGIEEAQHTAELFGASVTLSAAKGPGHGAVIGGGDRSHCLAAAAPGVAFINTACTDDSLRCAGMVWHVAPSDSMLRNAGSDALAWDPSLERFGADTLNRRFQARFNRVMTADAWTAWFAVKVVWETALRARSGDPARILALLPSLQFDGHKGARLRFDADHQLRQPLYRNEAGRLIEVADAGPAVEAACK